MQSYIHYIEAISEIMIPDRQMSYASFSGDGGQIDQFYNYWLVKGLTIHRMVLVVLFFFKKISALLT